MRNLAARLHYVRISQLLYPLRNKYDILSSVQTPFRTDSERHGTDFTFHLKKLQKEPEILRFQALL